LYQILLESAGYRAEIFIFAAMQDCTLPLLAFPIWDMDNELERARLDIITKLESLRKEGGQFRLAAPHLDAFCAFPVAYREKPDRMPNLLKQEIFPGARLAPGCPMCQFLPGFNEIRLFPGH
jgi:hypothetical protein